MHLKHITLLAVTATALFTACHSNEQEIEDTTAQQLGSRQAILLAEAIGKDSLQAQLCIIDIRSREDELRHCGAADVADKYIGAFFETLDSVNPSLAATLRRAGDR